MILHVVMLYFKDYVRYIFETRKNNFYFTSKPLSVLEILKLRILES